MSACHLGRDNVVFLASGFEDAPLDETFDVVASRANHSIFDRQTRYRLKEYFDRCRMLLKESGVFVFESHAPNYEGARLQDRGEGRALRKDRR